jgi:uracil-DNA glycosylase
MLLILGEHDKGTGTPFHPSTVSGRRLRTILAEIRLSVRMENVYKIDGRGRCTPNNLVEMANGSRVVVLGRIAAEECKRQGIEATYLPHPAARVRGQLDQLRTGLLAIKQAEAQRDL